MSKPGSDIYWLQTVSDEPNDALDLFVFGQATTAGGDQAYHRRNRLTEPKSVQQLERAIVYQLHFRR